MFYLNIKFSLSQFDFSSFIINMKLMKKLIS